MTSLGNRLNKAKDQNVGQEKWRKPSNKFQKALSKAGVPLGSLQLVPMEGGGQAPGIVVGGKGKDVQLLFAVEGGKYALETMPGALSQVQQAQ